MSFSQSPFEEIKMIEIQKEQLYEDILFKYDENDVKIIWKEFIGETIPKLERILLITRTLFTRYFDEFNKDAKNQKDGELNKELLDKIADILQLHLENTLLLDQYLHIMKEDENALHSDLLKILVSNELQKQFIGGLFFSTKLPKTVLKKLSPLVSEQYKVTQLDSLLKNLKQQSEESTNEIEIVMKRNLNKGKFYLYNVEETIQKITDDWWWDDTILFSSIYDEANYYLTKSLLLQNGEIKEIETLYLPLTKAKNILRKSRFNYENGIKTASKGIHKQALRYFRLVLKSTEIGLQSLVGSSEEMKELRVEFESINAKTKLLELIAQLTSQYNSISKKILMNDKEAILKSLGEIKHLTQNYTPVIEVRYLSNLPDIFDALASTLELLISLGKEYDELSEEMNYRLLQFNARIDVAITQLINQLEDLKKFKDILDTKMAISQLIQDCDILIETASFIPISIIERITTIRRLNTLKNLALSINEDIKAYEANDKNIIKVLIHKARANYYAEESLKSTKQQNSKSLPMERIIAQFNGSYVSAYLNEIEIYQLNIQYLCINEILPKMISILANPSSVENIEKLRDELWSDSNFTGMLNLIKADCQKLLEHKQNNNNYQLTGMNWEEIEDRFNIISGLIDFYESIKFATLGSVATLLEKFDDANIFYTQAQDMAFAASTPLKEVHNEHSAEYANHVFSFAQFTQDSANKAKLRSKIRLPVQEIIKLFRDMIFNM